MNCRSVRDTPGLTQELSAAGIHLSVHANVNDRRLAHKQGFQLGAGAVAKIQKVPGLVNNDYAGYVAFCRDVVDNYGVTYVGGCCGCGPFGIQKMAEEFSHPNGMKPTDAEQRVQSLFLGQWISLSFLNRNG